MLKISKIGNKNPKYILSCQYEEKYLIDDVETVIDSKSPIQFDHLPIVQRLEKRTVVDSYVNKLNVSITAEEYKIALEKLRLSDSNGDWSNIEDEYNYKKFIAYWTPIRREEIVRHDISVPVSHYPKIESEYLTAFQVTTDFSGDGKNAFYSLKPTAFAQIFEKVCSKNGFTRLRDDANYSETTGLKYSFHRSGSLEYLTIGGNYISESLSKYRIVTPNTYQQLTTDLEKAEEYFDSYVKGIKSRFSSTPIQRKFIIERLELVENNLKKVRSTKQNESLLRSIRTLMTETLSSLYE